MLPGMLVESWCRRQRSTTISIQENESGREGIMLTGKNGFATGSIVYLDGGGLIILARSSHVARGDRHAVAPHAVLVHFDAKAGPLEALHMAVVGTDRLPGHVLG